jgi:hypothetical protein
MSETIQHIQLGVFMFVMIKYAYNDELLPIIKGLYMMFILSLILSNVNCK